MCRFVHCPRFQLNFTKLLVDNLTLNAILILKLKDKADRIYDIFEIEIASYIVDLDFSVCNETNSLTITEI